MGRKTEIEKCLVLSPPTAWWGQQLREVRQKRKMGNERLDFVCRVFCFVLFFCFNFLCSCDREWPGSWGQETVVYHGVIEAPPRADWGTLPPPSQELTWRWSPTSLFRDQLRRLNTNALRNSKPWTLKDLIAMNQPIMNSEFMLLKGMFRKYFSP